MTKSLSFAIIMIVKSWIIKKEDTYALSFVVVL